MRRFGVMLFFSYFC